VITFFAPPIARVGDEGDQQRQLDPAVMDDPHADIIPP
jgi:hypothetical protein